MKHKLTAGLIVLLCLVNVQALQAQDSTRTITLKEAVDLSVTNSHLLKNNKAKISEATAAIQEAKERLLPDVNVSGTYMYLPTSPNIHLASDTSGKGFGGPKVSQVAYGSLNVSLPLYTGGKLKYGIESAKYLQEAAKLDAADNKEAVIINTINAYSNLYKSLKAVTLVKENLEQSNQRVKDFTNLEQNGLIARNDLLKVKLQSSNIELTLLDAQSNYKIASVNMALMLGLPEQTLLVADSASLQQPGDVKSIEAYEQLALQSRNDISALALRKKSAELGIKSAKADYYPNIALTTGYIAADIPKFLTVTNAVTVGLGVKYSLSSLWKTKSKIEQADARIQQITASQDMLNDNIRLQINQAYQAYLLSRKKIEVYQQAVEQAAENYRITKNKYDNALATTTDLLDADVAQLQSKLNVSNATADAVVAYNKLLQTAGILNN
ncbi:MAG: TolC family protein [Ferruginibacter sp.]|uniref:TolC family protein n=1 Tax=Ferruginibacter sp. TaxID=1940288 RepID=UPI00265948DA|nr:TolC family protein [Ferruginibacter sp.]MDB5276898.1 TolC family protein [Ferruginibacter sp.]